MRSASLKRYLPRSRALIFRQGPLSNARRAAMTALSMSGLAPSATWVMTSPVAGLSVSKVFPLAEFNHLPPISIFVCRTAMRGFADADAILVFPFPLDFVLGPSRVIVLILLLSVLHFFGSQRVAIRG